MCRVVLFCENVYIWEEINVNILVNLFDVLFVFKKTICNEKIIKIKITQNELVKSHQIDDVTLKRTLTSKTVVL